MVAAGQPYSCTPSESSQVLRLHQADAAGFSDRLAILGDCLMRAQPKRHPVLVVDDDQHRRDRQPAASPGGDRGGNLLDVPFSNDKFEVEQEDEGQLPILPDVISIVMR